MIIKNKKILLKNFKYQININDNNNNLNKYLLFKKK